MTYLSVVIPAYNEEDRIGKTIIRIVNYLSAQNYNWEIIIVDDGSSDKTCEVARKTVDDERIRIIRNPVNSGKGFSVKGGMAASKGDIILFSDADLSTPIDELDKILPCMRNGYDVVIGSRALPNSAIEMPQVWYRRIMGKIFNLLVRAFILSSFRDTQCGFKCFKKEAAIQIFSCQRLNRFAFDVEVLYIASKRGLKIKELPVRWANGPHSHVSLLTSSISMLVELLKIRLYDWKGYYN